MLLHLLTSCLTTTGRLIPAILQGTGYCSKGHRAKAMASAANVTAVGPHVDRVLSGGKTDATGFRLSCLSNTHPEYVSLRQQFNSKLSKSAPMTLRSVFEIQVRGKLIGIRCCAFW